MNKNIEINIGARLGNLRKRKKMTLDELSSKSGVSKSILSQIERNISNPTVSTMIRISEALDETLSNFFTNLNKIKDKSIQKAKETPLISSKDGLCSLTILGAGETVNWLQWYMLTMKPKGKLKSKSHGSNTYENITVLNGEVEIQLKQKTEILKTGDTFRFETNQDHCLINKFKGITKLLMVNYIDPINGSFS
ncbi:MAG: XRE family transcriptional regulator [Pelagibacteraceae bacterium]|nr:XRE family transcriptional regulator [Pelagibacteraceae bacterium]|tara:strand:- start:1020 stop:1601 length:582 start_codon:yes stop_codon:yes gene_type:complete